MKEIGKMICNMERVSKSGLMDLHTLGITILGRSKE
jgi:hypothetical protein